MRVALAWSSQNPGAPISFSSSARRAASASGSKVITDPGELGPDLLHALVEWLAVGLGHAASVAAPWVGISSLDIGDDVHVSARSGEVECLAVAPDSETARSDERPQEAGSSREAQTQGECRGTSSVWNVDHNASGIRRRDDHVAERTETRRRVSHLDPATRLEPSPRSRVRELKPSRGAAAVARLVNEHETRGFEKRGVARAVRWEVHRAVT